VEAHQRGQVEVGEDVAVEGQEATGKLLGRELDRTRGPARLGLLDVAKPGRPTLTEHLAHLVRLESACQHHLVHPMATQPVDHVGEKRAAGERHHRLGDGVGEGTQACALATDQDQRLHRG